MLKLTVSLALVTLVACSQCPNSEVCEAGQSCCQAPTGEFSCCPFHHGECCEDHLHCCPEGMLCQVVESICSNATHTLPWVDRTPTKQTGHPKPFRMLPTLPASEDDIICPDGSCCPVEFSCLQMASSYGCCPVAQGIVCSDGKHCCPKGHECSADSSSCVKQGTHKEPVVLCGDGMSECPMDSTCCEKEVNEQWACCPMPRAVCCEDRVHCCPEDSVCDVKSSKCVSSTNQELPMWAKFPARLRAEWEDHMGASVDSDYNVPCNDTAACPDETTCCKTKEGEWACCPLPEAVCCDDFIHCCPHGKICNVAAGSCDDTSGSVPWFEKVPVRPISSQNVADTQDSDYNVPCNDTAACPDETTCCKTKEGEWACCPLPEAVCCDDFIHCCPHGKICNVAAGSCDDTSGSVPWFEKVPVQPISSQKVANKQGASVDSDYNVPCNDTAACPDETTCCKTKEGEWACCPLPEAVCCDDFIHCCPHDKICNVAAGSCDDPSGSVPWFEKVPVQRISSQNLADTQVSSVDSDYNVPCNDTAACPDETTCCKTKEGEWACCPLPEAVCCDDFIHCCPHGKICNVAAGSCDDTSGSVPWFEKVPVRPISSQNVADTQDSDYNVPCNDTAACPDETTCCKTKEGEWACCPLPEAVCCDDFIHCCPHGKICNVAAGSCDDTSGSVPWFEKVPVQPISSQKVANKQGASVDSDYNVPCNDTAACPDETTCCKTKEGEWDCCPLPEAVCCDDFIHCCPHGKICNVAAGSCDDPSGSVPWFEKVPVQRISSQNLADTQVSSVDSDYNVPCNDTAACPDETTCCKTKEGEWACCPLPEAVCCDDFIHCCPHGKICNVAAGSCDDTSGSVPWFEKVPVRPISSQNVADTQDSDYNVPCNDTAACPDETTCCKTKEGEWACCPLPEAVCCDDFIHCCPHGKICNVAAGSCDDTSGSVPWFEKVPVQPISSQKVANKQGASVDSDYNVPCNDTAACPDETTCCKTKEGEWACCPLPEAVCCDDFIHCCPHGKICNVAAGSCDDTSGSVPWFEKVPVQRISSQNVANTQGASVDTDYNVPCNDTAACPDETTCCKTKEGEWACCPLPEAVCCDDFIHCCPHGKICNVAAGSCDDTSGSVPWFEKVPVQRISSQNVANTQVPSIDSKTNVACDDFMDCPDESTCCKAVDGKLSCCPFPDAVCCPDQEHCCPTGYECDMHGRSCVKSIWLQMDTVPLTHTGRSKPQPSISEKDIQCGGAFSCLDGETCCPSSETSWGCCPSAKAVCCKDMKHCCPAGYQCGEGGVCT
ncbi:uncharacterized protein LOC127647338 [Xyrauchen texanus]|uniref:uncharacterized protein LOC127647338 n=1 Tax=Xyrauchen texanus TaxID=154827 RepID=UPI002241C3BB|nr:uncharacterized protein LOC127647338 [Xyrauchen texanus]